MEKTVKTKLNVSLILVKLLILAFIFSPLISQAKLNKLDSIELVLDGTPRNPIAIDQRGLVYVTTNLGNLGVYELNANAKLKLIAKHEFVVTRPDKTKYSDWIEGEPLFDALGTIYIAGRSGWFYALKFDHIKNQFTLIDKIQLNRKQGRAFPIIDKFGAVIVPSFFGRSLQVVSLENGKLKVVDTYTFSGPPHSSPIIDSNGVIYAAGFTSFYAFRLDQNRKLKLLDFVPLGPLYATPVLKKDGALVISSYSNGTFVYVLDEKNKFKLLSNDKNLAKYGNNGPSIKDNNQIIYSSSAGSLNAFEVDSKGSINLLDDFSASISISLDPPFLGQGGYVYVSDDETRLYVLKLNQKRKFDLIEEVPIRIGGIRGILDSKPAMDKNGVLYLYSHDGLYRGKYSLNAYDSGVKGRENLTFVSQRYTELSKGPGKLVTKMLMARNIAEYERLLPDLHFDLIDKKISYSKWSCLKRDLNLFKDDLNRACYIANCGDQIKKLLTNPFETNSMSYESQQALNQIVEIGETLNKSLMGSPCP